jgi:ATP-binding cassette subfamily F protein uup
VIEAVNVTKRFGARTVVRDFSTRILRGDRVGIVGPNGAGKTTLLRLLTGALAPDGGSVRHGSGLSIGYVDQRRDSLDLDATPWQTLCPDGGDQILVQGQLRHVVGYLRDFLFRPEQARTPIRALSGGERNRLLLARQLATPCNLLVLDEPTNDLDIDTLDLLQEVLAEFAGTLLLVSHDRDFLDRLVTSVIAFEGDGRLQEYAGGYSDHLRQRRPTVAPPAAARPRAPGKAGGGGGPGRLASRRQRDLDRVIGEIGSLEAEIQALEHALCDPDLFGRDPRAFHRQSERLAERRAALLAAEERWSALEVGLAQAGA